jgi:hypothetical protein
MPQFIGSLMSCASQPSASTWLQSTKPGSQAVREHMKFSQVRVACGTGGQGWPQAPQ